MHIEDCSDSDSIAATVAARRLRPEGRPARRSPQRPHRSAARRPRAEGHRPRRRGAGEGRRARQGGRPADRARPRRHGAGRRARPARRRVGAARACRTSRSAAAQAEVAGAEAEVADRSAAVELATREVQRQELLLSKQVGAERDYDRAKTELDRAQAARAHQRGAAGADARRLPRAGRPRRRDRKSTARRRSCGSRKSSRARARSARPADGIVMHRMVEPGQLLAAGQTGLTLALTDRLYVRTFIPETKLGLVKHGQAAQVTVDAFPGQTFDGDGHRDRARRRVHAEGGRDAGRARQPGLRREGRSRRGLERAARARAAGRGHRARSTQPSVASNAASRVGATS